MFPCLLVENHLADRHLVDENCKRLYVDQLLIKVSFKIFSHFGFRIQQLESRGSSNSDQPFQVAILAPKQRLPF